MPRKIRRQKLRFIDPLLVSIPEFSKLSGLGQSMVRQLILDGELPTRLIRERRWILREEAVARLREKEAAGGSQGETRTPIHSARAVVRGGHRRHQGRCYATGRSDERVGGGARSLGRCAGAGRGPEDGRVGEDRDARQKRRLGGSYVAKRATQR